MPTDKDEERNTILAALRWYQHCGMGDPFKRPDWLQNIACPDPCANTSLDDEGIDELCERLNCEDDGPSNTVERLIWAQDKADTTPSARVRRETKELFG